uniref:Integrase catalytic domain-containing protein n=1 Tax=Dendroctonus ponderosae TaxID=77166 RepID=A0AAR5P0N8_DENPD
MHLEIQRYTHQCLICATAKAQQRQNAAPMTARSSRYPFEMLALDILGPYPESGPQKNTYVLQVEDVFSRWLEAKAFPEIHGRDIATYLEEEMFSRYGAPRVIISDNGTPFTSNAFQRLCRERQIQHRTTSVYHQRAKTSERRAQELKKVLRILLTGKPENQWGKYLSSALKVLRSRKNRATGETPASIVLGYELPCPGDWSTQYAKYRRTLTPQQRKNHNREVFERQLVFQKEYSSDVRPPVSFAPSDKVMTKNRQPGAFGPKWTGPWDIITATGQSTYKVLINGRQWNVHVDELRPAPPGNPEPIPDDDIDYASESESEEEFEFGEDFRRTSEPSEEPMPSSPPRPESPTPGPSSVLTEEENTALAQIHAIRAQGRTKEPVLGQLSLAPNLQLAAKTVEELTKHMLKLDTVDTRKNLRLRAERKQAIEELESLAQRVEATNANQESVGIPRAPEGIGFPTSIPRVPNPVALRGMNPKK